MKNSEFWLSFTLNVLLSAYIVKKQYDHIKFLYAENISRQVKTWAKNNNSAKYGISKDYIDSGGISIMLTKTPLKDLKALQGKTTPEILNYLGFKLIVT